MLWRFGKGRSVSVMNGKRFIAAFSDRPFSEAKRGAEFPDYSFHTYGNMHWCVRVGDIDIRWGFGNDRIYANGVITVSRMNVSAASFSGKGLPYVRVGEVFYLYDEELRGGSYEGFIPYMRKKVAEVIGNISEGKSPEELAAAIRNIGSHPDLAAILNEHRLVIKSVSIGGVGAASKPDENDPIKFSVKEEK